MVSISGDGVSTREGLFTIVGAEIEACEYLDKIKIRPYIATFPNSPTKKITSVVSTIIPIGVDRPGFTKHIYPGIEVSSISDVGGGIYEIVVSGKQAQGFLCSAAAVFGGGVYIEFSSGPDDFLGGKYLVVAVDVVNKKIRLNAGVSGKTTAGTGVKVRAIEYIEAERWVTLVAKSVGGAIEFEVIPGDVAQVGGSIKPSIDSIDDAGKVIIGDVKLTGYKRISKEYIEYSRRHAESSMEIQENVHPGKPMSADRGNYDTYAELFGAINNGEDGRYLKTEGEDFVALTKTASMPKQQLDDESSACQSGDTKIGMMFLGEMAANKNVYILDSSAGWNVMSLNSDCDDACEVGCQLACQLACQSSCQSSCECGHEWMPSNGGDGRSYITNPLDPLNGDTCHFCDTNSDSLNDTYVENACPTSADNPGTVTCKVSCEGIPECTTTYQTRCTSSCESSCECAHEILCSGSDTCFACDAGSEYTWCNGQVEWPGDPPSSECNSLCEVAEIPGYEGKECVCDDECQLGCQVSTQPYVCGSCMTNCQTGCEAGCQTCDLCETCQACENGEVVMVPITGFNIVEDPSNTYQRFWWNTFSVANITPPGYNGVPLTYQWSSKVHDEYGYCSFEGKNSSVLKIMYMNIRSSDVITCKITDTTGAVITKTFAINEAVGWCNMAPSISLSFSNTIIPGRTVTVTANNLNGAKPGNHTWIISGGHAEIVGPTKMVETISVKGISVGSFTLTFWTLDQCAVERTVSVTKSVVGA